MPSTRVAAHHTWLGTTSVASRAGFSTSADVNTHVWPVAVLDSIGLPQALLRADPQGRRQACPSLFRPRHPSCGALPGPRTPTAALIPSLGTPLSSMLTCHPGEQLSGPCPRHRVPSCLGQHRPRPGLSQMQAFLSELSRRSCCPYPSVAAPCPNAH